MLLFRVVLIVKALFISLFSTIFKGFLGFALTYESENDTENKTATNKASDSLVRFSLKSMRSFHGFVVGSMRQNSACQSL